MLYPEIPSSFILMPMKWMLCFVCLLLVSCGGRESSDLDNWLNEGERLRVLSTVGMVDDLVRQVGGDQVARQLLVGPALDPHTYELVKGDQEKLGGADLILYSGLGLEHGASIRSYLVESERAVAVGDGIVASFPEARIVIDGETDPHIWMDVSLWAYGADLVAEALAERDPFHAHLFRERAAQVKEHLGQVDGEIRDMVARVPSERRYLVTTHDAFHYFVRRYMADSDDWQERCIAPQGISPEGELSIADICRVVRQLEQHRVPVLFLESNLSPEAMERIVFAGTQRGMAITIAEEPLYGDAMGEPCSDGATYSGMMQHNARVISEHLLHGV
jgi:manganese/zinc/iron transport system substrate-binding protein